MSRLPVLGAVVLLSLSHVASAQDPPEPRQGQPGKDVIYMPTPEPLVERMLTMAQVGPRDVVYDLGSGDGRTVIAAAKRGAKAIGIEYNPELVSYAQSKAKTMGVAQKASFVQGDIFEKSYSDATVVTLYLLSTLNMRLRPTLLKLRPGTRVVSHAFSMEDWSPDEVSRAEQRTAYLWIVPAPVEGTWNVQLTGGPTFDMTLTQKFQKLEGTLAFGTVEAGLREPVLRGDAIQFGFVGQDGVWYELDGTVADGKMSGTYQVAGTSKENAWTATRK
jgi:SAM-dependent methyltransferase